MKQNFLIVLIIVVEAFSSPLANSNPERSTLGKKSRVPLSFQDFVDASMNSNFRSNNNFDLETFTKNAAIRTNRDRLRGMPTTFNNPLLARDISNTGDLSAFSSFPSSSSLFNTDNPALLYRLAMANRQAALQQLSFDNYPDDTLLPLNQFNNPLLQNQLTPFDRQVLARQWEKRFGSNAFNNPWLNSLGNMEKFDKLSAHLQRKRDSANGLDLDGANSEQGIPVRRDLTTTEQMEMKKFQAPLPFLMAQKNPQ